MNRPARFTVADLRRAAKVAKETGMAFEFKDLHGEIVRVEPPSSGQATPVVPKRLLVA